MSYQPTVMGGGVATKVKPTAIPVTSVVLTEQPVEKKFAATALPFTEAPKVVEVPKPKISSVPTKLFGVEVKIFKAPSVGDIRRLLGFTDDFAAQRVAKYIERLSPADDYDWKDFLSSEQNQATAKVSEFMKISQRAEIHNAKNLLDTVYDVLTNLMESTKEKSLFENVISRSKPTTHSLYRELEQLSQQARNTRVSLDRMIKEIEEFIDDIEKLVTALSTGMFAALVISDIAPIHTDRIDVRLVSLKKTERVLLDLQISVSSTLNVCKLYSSKLFDSAMTDIPAWISVTSVESLESTTKEISRNKLREILSNM